MTMRRLRCASAGQGTPALLLDQQGEYVVIRPDVRKALDKMKQSAPCGRFGAVFLSMIVLTDRPTARGKVLIYFLRGKIYSFN